ncbi:MAG: glycosyltransferase family 2 protein [Lacrimispora sp.]|uniref:glycosyltransferase family 2 protein n=1 Tax=Lacrimispora sp. TaxID=2719234 RepID=UPI0039E560DA
MDKVLVVIPAYNEALNIERVVGEVIKNYPVFDYVIINDGSTDHTADICRDHGWKIIDLPINLGLAGAFQTGLKYAHRHGYRYAVQFDGDGQHRPEYILPMKEKMDEGYDIVIGSRFVSEKKPLSMRMLGSSILSGAIWLTTGVKVNDPTSGMRMFSQKMIKEFADGLNYGPEPDTISYLIKQGAKVSEIPVTMDERILGESYLNPVNAARYMGKMLFSILLVQSFRIRNRG